jgi:hypothetical protein
MPLTMSVRISGVSFVAGNVSLDQAGCDAVDPDAVRPKFARHRLGEAKNTGLGGRIVRPAEDAAAALRRHRRHARDRALLARTHVRDEGLAQVEYARHIHVDDALPVFGLDLHQLHRLRDAGIVDEDIDLTEGRDRLLGRALTALEIGNIAAESDVTISQFAGRVLGALCVEVEHRYPRPVLGEQLRRRAADAARACRARDDGILALQQHWRFSLILARVIAVRSAHPQAKISL